MSIIKGVSCKHKGGCTHNCTQAAKFTEHQQGHLGQLQMWTVALSVCMAHPDNERESDFLFPVCLKQVVMEQLGVKFLPSSYPCVYLCLQVHQKYNVSLSSLSSCDFGYNNNIVLVLRKWWQRDVRYADNSGIKFWSKLLAIFPEIGQQGCLILYSSVQL